MARNEALISCYTPPEIKSRQDIHYFARQARCICYNETGP